MKPIGYLAGRGRPEARRFRVCFCLIPYEDLDPGMHLQPLGHPQAGVLPLGTEAEEASDVGRGESSIDGVQGAALLVWAAQELGDPSLRDMAVRHARRHIEFCIREDGSVCQAKLRQNFRALRHFW